MTELLFVVAVLWPDTVGRLRRLIVPYKLSTAHHSFLLFAGTCSEPLLL
jgi:hypothetical protein